MKGGLVVVFSGTNRETGRKQYKSYGISQVSDRYVVDKLRELEQVFPDAENFTLDRFVSVGDEVDDGEGMENYEMLKLEAETRGLVWR